MNKRDIGGGWSNNNCRAETGVKFPNEDMKRGRLCWCVFVKKLTDNTAVRPFRLAPHLGAVCHDELCTEESAPTPALVCVVALLALLH